MGQLYKKGSKAGRQLAYQIAVLIDWLLILAGALLVVIALWRINLPVAKYGLAIIGALVGGVGAVSHFRRQRKKLSKKS